MIQSTDKKLCHFMITIERRLKAYVECEEHTERHEILWHEWNHNKRWLTQVQQYILPSFPSYSMHDVSHSEVVLHNIEMLLGEKNIRELSATDCFVLLHTVYIHDIGMCITHADRKEMIENEKFHKFLLQLRENQNGDSGYYADILLRECFHDENEKENESEEKSNQERREYILNKKLEVYYAVIFLMAEYRRREHGDVSKNRLIDWIEKPDKLGIGFSAIEIPRRFFYMIANCASTHTNWDFSAVLNLNQEDTGFVHDYVHPRFIAILLQLGDALDMDNNRFHPLTKEYMGKLPNMSELHYGKHKAIRRLRITNQKISISADCENQDELRLVRQECDGIQSILEKASYYWSVIRPKDSDVGLPTLDKTELLIKGMEIPSELVQAKFEISQEKAFNLLKGNTIYEDEHFVFLRELLQNAVDATKIQYFRDCKRYVQRMDKQKMEEPYDFKTIMLPEKYPIKIKLTAAKCQNGKEILPIDKEDASEPQERLHGYECGVHVKITDYGVGINKNDIKRIAEVGTSYENRRRDIDQMPSWMQPTGRFGIGLQSAFLAASKITATSYSYEDSPYEITFYPRHGDSNGYINVTPKDDDDNLQSCGTYFELFVPNSKKKLHADSPQTWSGMDPFGDGYETSQQIRHSIELIKQMAMYLGKMVGEPLFPVSLDLSDDCLDEKQRKKMYSESFKKEFQNSGITLCINGKKCTKGSGEDFNISWLYRIGNGFKGDSDSDKKYQEPWVYKNDYGDICHLNRDKVELYVWNRRYSAFARLGIKRILLMREQSNSFDQTELSADVEIFYKGIKVTEYGFREDANLVESIDLKATLEDDLLKLNRNGFSQKGYEHLEKVYKEIVKISREALKKFDRTCLDQIEITVNGLLKKTERKYPTDSKDEQDIKLEIEQKMKEAEKTILSAAALTYFSMVDEKDDFFEVESQQKTNAWNVVLRSLDRLRKEHEKRMQKSYIENFWSRSTLYNLPYWTIDDGVLGVKSRLSVFDIIDNERKYAIVSVRGNDRQSWSEYLVELGDLHGQIKSDVVKLRHENDMLRRKELMRDLEKKVSLFFKGKYVDDIDATRQVRKERIILEWFLNNVPTMALFSSPDGNTRVNILDTQICDSLYVDWNQRALVIERIREIYEKRHVLRFSTPIWSGYRYLEVSKPVSGVQFVKRGKVSSIGRGDMIVPLTGEEICKLYKMTEDRVAILKSKTEKIYENVIAPVWKYVETMSKDEEEFDTMVSQVRAGYRSYIRQLLKTSDATLTASNEGTEKLDDSQCASIVRLWEDDNLSQEQKKIKDLMPETVNKGILELKKAWQKKELNDVKQDLRKEFCDNSKSSFRNLVNYTVKNANMKPSQKQVEALYFRYICEVQYVMQLSCEKRILQMFERETSDLLLGMELDLALAKR